MRELNIAELDLVVGGLDGDSTGLGSGDDNFFGQVHTWLDGQPDFHTAAGGFQTTWGYMSDSDLMSATATTSPVATCPAGHTCIAYTNGGINEGKYVQDTSDGKLYFTAEWAAKVQNGTINWGGVLRDLAVVAGGGMSGAGAGVIGIVGGLLGTYAVYGYDVSTGRATS